MKCSKCSQEAVHPIITPCGHIFCYDCIKAHLPGRCPVCGSDINSHNIVVMYTGNPNDEYFDIEMENTKPISSLMFGDSSMESDISDAHDRTLMGFSFMSVLFIALFILVLWVLSYYFFV